MEKGFSVKDVLDQAETVEKKATEYFAKTRADVCDEEGKPLSPDAATAFSKEIPYREFTKAE